MHAMDNWNECAAKWLFMLTNEDIQNVHSHGENDHANSTMEATHSTDLLGIEPENGI